MAAEPMSWFMIETGWKVFDSEGDEAGTVDEVLGDTELDIFTGITIATRVFSAPRYCPSEHVKEIYEGAVALDLTTPEVDELEAYSP
jgi:hypothetical protein